MVNRCQKAVYATPEVHEKLKIAAARAHKPMNEYLADLLEADNRAQ